MVCTAAALDDGDNIVEKGDGMPGGNVGDGLLGGVVGYGCGEIGSLN